MVFVCTVCTLLKIQGIVKEKKIDLFKIFIPKLIHILRELLKTIEEMT
jgi:hypothetical protein